MEAGNLSPKETIEMDYFKYPMPRFKRFDLEKTLVFRPHHTQSIEQTRSNYKALSPKYAVAKEIDCSCLNNDLAEVITDVSSSAYPTLLWINPQLMKTECIAAFINAWKSNSNATNKVALAIVLPKGQTLLSNNGIFEAWNIVGSKPSYYEINALNEPVWYPSLARDTASLNDAATFLNPYDVFPLVEFSESSVEWGEKTVASHYSMLEQYRTRTRNFIYIDVSHPDRAFQQFHKTLKALRQSGSSVFQPIITPGGDITTFMTTLLSGVLAEAYFLTPREEIPIKSGKEAEGVIVLRKCA